MSDLVKNPEDMFSPDMAHIIQLKKVDPITIKLLVLITVLTMKSVFLEKVCWLVCLFEALRPSLQFFSYFGMASWV